jgi:hypothetical protein
MAIGILSRDEIAFQRQYAFHPGNSQPFVTEPFELKGRNSNVEVEIRTDLDNQSAVFALALINEQTGQAYDFGRQVAYYHGRDSDGSWTEGSARDSITIPRVPSGRYYVRVEADMDDNAPPMRYQLIVRRDVPSGWLYLVAGALLAIPPALISFRALTFNSRRWKESDYGS